MGRIKTKLIKRTALKLFAEHKDKFKKGDYGENKKQVAALINVSSKKLRNIIAGYITRLIKKTDE